MTIMVIVPYITPKGKMSGINNFDENGESHFVEVSIEATREEWLQSKTKLGYTILGGCLVNVTVLHTMNLTIFDETGETYAALPLNGDKVALIPLNQGGEVKIHS